MSDNKEVKEVEATVTSNKMDKTIVASINRKVKHPFYGKYLNRDTKFYAHDPENKCEEGDKVRIRNCKPLSKLKRWKLVEIID